MIFDFSIERIFDGLNDKNGTSLVSSDFIISQPTSNAGSWMEGQLVGNTLIRLTATDEANIAGTNIFAYDRIDIQNIVSMLGGSVVAPDTYTTAHQIIALLESQHGIKMYSEDIVDSAIFDDAGTNKVTLTAQPGSFSFIGEATFTVIAALKDIADDITVSDLSDEFYIRQNDKGWAETLTYPIDFTDDFDYLSTVTVGTTDMTQLAAILTDKMGQTWSADDVNANLSLANCTITHAGPYEAGLLANSTYKNVIIIELDGTLINTVIDGTVIMHFDDPSELDFDPSVV